MQRRTILTSAAFLAAAAAGPLRAAVQESSRAFSALGAKPSGARLERMQASPHFSNGTFHNLMPVIDPIDRERSSSMLRFLTEDKTGRRPLERIPSIKTDLSTLATAKWFGSDTRLLPETCRSLDCRRPRSARCFPGLAFSSHSRSRPLRPATPALDLLILTHDHYDHLDMLTMRDLKNRTAHVVCPLGVGAISNTGDGKPSASRKWTGAKKSLCRTRELSPACRANISRVERSSAIRRCGRAL